MPGDTKFCRGQQDYKAYSLGIFRGKCSGFVRFYVPGNNTFSQVPHPRKYQVLLGSACCLLGLSYLTIYNPAAGCALLGCEKCYHAAPFRVSEMSVLLFYGCRNCRLCAALLRCASRAHAFRGYKISKRLLWTPKSPNTLQGLRNLQYLFKD